MFFSKIGFSQQGVQKNQIRRQILSKRKRNTSKSKVFVNLPVSLSNRKAEFFSVSPFPQITRLSLT